MKAKQPEYWSVRSEAEVEFFEKKSRFIGICSPLNGPEEADLFIRKQRERFPDATHHVYAWRLGLGTKLQRYSDDGEPQGTAGLPVLDVLRKQEIEQAGLVVVRYYGGIQLGAGGLVRAYSQAAAEAVKLAQPLKWQIKRNFALTCPYGLAETLYYRLDLAGYYQTQQAYLAEVSWQVAVLPEEIGSFKKLLADATAGQVEARELELAYFPENNE